MLIERHARRPRISESLAGRGRMIELWPLSQSEIQLTGLLLETFCGIEILKRVVLYTGRQTVPLSDRIWAVPISELWA
jgi:predicted AAA+ superfamily ATPase